MIYWRGEKRQGELEGGRLRQGENVGVKDGPVDRSGDRQVGFATGGSVCDESVAHHGEYFEPRREFEVVVFGHGAEKGERLTDNVDVPGVNDEPGTVFGEFVRENGLLGKGHRVKVQEALLELDAPDSVVPPRAVPPGREHLPHDLAEVRPCGEGDKVFDVGGGVTDRP